ncbi:MAG TPA: TrkA C-terminal domain-containing protein [Acidimicrobiales bacterium]|nr:TrkA C-terminal domain-containing protein [Acidimicrobiales bacterium]
MDLAHGRVKLIEVTLASDSPPVTQGLTLDDLRLPDAVTVVSVVRGDRPMVPTDTMRFQEHDHVILMSREDATQDAAAAFIA